MTQLQTAPAPVASTSPTGDHAGKKRTRTPAPPKDFRRAALRWFTSPAWCEDCDKRGGSEWCGCAERTT